MLEVRFAEETPGGSEVVIWLGFTEETTFLLPMAVEGDDGVYARYPRDGGRTGLYVDAAREVSVRSAAHPSADRPAVDPYVDGGAARAGNGRNRRGSRRSAATRRTVTALGANRVRF